MRVESSVVLQRDGKPVEGARSLRTVATYDADGNLIMEESYLPDGSLKWVRTSSRDDKGVKTTILNQDGKLFQKFVCTPNDKGRQLGCSTYNAGGALLHKYVRTYDEAGRVLEASTYDAKGSLMNKAVFTRDAAGKQSVDELYDAAGVLIQKQEIIGDEVIVTMYRPDGNVWRRLTSKTSTSEYDSHGNWVRRAVPQTVANEGNIEEKVFIDYRTVTYYPEDAKSQP